MRLALPARHEERSWPCGLAGARLPVVQGLPPFHPHARQRLSNWCGW